MTICFGRFDSEIPEILISVLISIGNPPFIRYFIKMKKGRTFAMWIHIEYVRPFFIEAKNGTWGQQKNFCWDPYCIVICKTISSEIELDVILYPTSSCREHVCLLLLIIESY